MRNPQDQQDVMSPMQFVYGYGHDVQSPHGVFSPVSDLLQGYSKKSNSMTASQFYSPDKSKFQLDYGEKGLVEHKEPHFEAADVVRNMIIG